jgi:hypothetical protein
LCAVLDEKLFLNLLPKPTNINCGARHRMNVIPGQ